MIAKHLIYDPAAEDPAVCIHEPEIGLRAGRRRSVHPACQRRDTADDDHLARRSGYRHLGFVTGLLEVELQAASNRAVAATAATSIDLALRDELILSASRPHGSQFQSQGDDEQ